MTSSIGVPPSISHDSHHGRQSALPAPDRPDRPSGGHHVVEGDDPHYQCVLVHDTAKSSPAVLKLSNASERVNVPAQSAYCEFVRRCSVPGFGCQHAVQQVFRIDIADDVVNISLQTRNLECGCSATLFFRLCHLRGDQTKSRFHAVSLKTERTGFQLKDVFNQLVFLFT